jgi:hypothetical protein
MRSTNTYPVDGPSDGDMHLAWWKLCIASAAAVFMAPLAVVVLAVVVITAFAVFPALPWFLSTAPVARQMPPRLPPGVIRLRPVGAPARHQARG